MRPNLSPRASVVALEAPPWSVGTFADTMHEDRDRGELARIGSGRDIDIDPLDRGREGQRRAPVRGGQRAPVAAATEPFAPVATGYPSRYDQLRIHLDGGAEWA